MMKIKNWLNFLTAAVLMFAALALFEPLKAQAQTSAENLPNSDTAASRNVEKPDFQKIINACAATAIDLEKTRVHVVNLERETSGLKDRLETEKRTTALLTELSDTRKGENRALSDALAAKNETIAAKNLVIEKQDALVGGLKNKKSSPIRKVGGVLLGIALVLLLK